jgi:hypothetical protein
VSALPRPDEDVASTSVLPPPIGGHRLASCGRSAALVRATGEIDWWCAPAFDGPPLLWSLLDPAGAAARWRTTRPVSVEGTPAGPSVRTTIRTDGGRLECRDAVISVGDGVALVRLVRALDGPMTATHELALGGFDGPWIDLDGDGPVTVVGPPGRVRDGWLVTEVAVDAAWRGLAVVVGGSGAPTLSELVVAVDEADDEFARRLRGVVLPRSQPRRAEQALAVLHACTYQPTGAVIASPTTSVPETPGGDRQFDYRYCWLRDAGLAAAVASMLGDKPTAERFLDFVCGAVEECGIWSPVVTVLGDALPDEREIAGVEGWAESRPVRVGNAASSQRQYDALGLLVEAISASLGAGGRLGTRRWRLVREIADAMVAEPADAKSNGIWERREPARMVSGDVGRWLALDRAITIARRHRPWTRRRHWKQARDAARARVLDAMAPDGRLPQRYDDEYRADASALMVPLFGMLSRRDARAHRLVDRVLEDLGAWPFVYRYEPDGADGFAAGEGAFLPTSYWAVSALAALGRVDEAEERLEAMCARLPEVLAEEVDPESGDSRGNVPLVWSHMELARALYLVDAARRRKRYGPIGGGAWRLGRFVVRRWGRP